MIGEEFRAGARALDDLEQQQHDAERQQDIAQRHRPLSAGHQRQREQRLGEADAGHQEDDDVVDRERNQKQRETDHGHRQAYYQAREPGYLGQTSSDSPLETVLPYSLAEFRQRRRDGAPFRWGQDSFFFRTWRPLYMPLFRSRWCGRRSSPESLS